MRPSAEQVTSSELLGVRVLELGTHISGAFAARILGDFGADVTKVEPAGGDPLRDPGRADAFGGAMFEYLNWNKSSTELDLTMAPGLDRVREMIAGADIIVSSIAPPAARQHGLLPAQIAACNEGAVVVSVTAFGADGPYADLLASELVIQAMGGVMAISGTTDEAPLKRGLRQSTFYSGINAAYAALAGLYAARVSGTGVVLDLARRDCVSAELVMNQSLYAFLGVLQSRPPRAADPFGGFPLPCQDGFVTIQASTAAPMSRIADVFGEPSLAAAAFASKESRTEWSAVLRSAIGPLLSKVRARDFFVSNSREGLLVGFVQSGQDMLTCDQMDARRAFLSFPDFPGTDGTPVRFPAPFGRLSGWADRRPVRRAPRLGEQFPAAAPPPQDPGTDPHRPFTSLRVLDLGQVFATPYVGGLLADLGADVIKIESPSRLDQARTDYGGYFDNQPGEDPWNRTSTFQVINRGKRAISLDLKNERGKEIFRALVREADVILENFTPRVLPGLGLGYDDLQRINPGLIMLSNSGFGGTGPWSAFKAQGTTLEATMGICTFTGYQQGEPSKAGQSYPDFLATWTGLTALLAALVGRLRAGQGQHIDLGMYELGVSVMPEAVLKVQLGGGEFERLGNREFDALASEIVPCGGGPEDWLAYSVFSPEEYRRLSEIVGGTGTTNLTDADATTAAVSAWTRFRTAESAAQTLQRSGIAAGRVLNARDLLTDPQLQHRRFYDTVTGFGDIGPRPIIGRPFTLRGGGTVMTARGRAPRFAEHTSDVLGGVAGLSESAIADAVANGAVALAPRNPPPAHPHDYGPMVANGSILSVGGDYHAVVRASMFAFEPTGLAPTETTAGSANHTGY